MKELISIIIPTYKRDTKMLERAINSINKQTYYNWELIIVDDNGIESEFSKKNELFIHKYKCKDNIVYIKHEKNKGANVARNTGIKKAKGNLIAFLDSDDEWVSNKLELLIKKYEESSEKVGVLFSGYYIVEGDSIMRDNQIKIDGSIFYKEIIGDHVSPTSCVLIKKECFDKVGYFDEKLPARQDYDMWLRISRYYEFVLVDQPLVYIYKGHESISSNHKNHVKATEMVMDKIFTYLNEDEIKEYSKEIMFNQYNYLALTCMRHMDNKLAREYLKKSIKAKISFKAIILLLLTYSSNLYKVLKYFRKKRRVVITNLMKEQY